MKIIDKCANQVDSVGASIDFGRGEAAQRVLQPTRG